MFLFGQGVKRAMALTEHVQKGVKPLEIRTAFDDGVLGRSGILKKRSQWLIRSKWGQKLGFGSHSCWKLGLVLFIYTTIRTNWTRYLIKWGLQKHSSAMNLPIPSLPRVVKGLTSRTSMCNSKKHSNKEENKLEYSRDWRIITHDHFKPSSCNLPEIRWRMVVGCSSKNLTTMKIWMMLQSLTDLLIQTN